MRLRMSLQMVLRASDANFSVITSHGSVVQVVAIAGS